MNSSSNLPGIAIAVKAWRRSESLAQVLGWLSLQPGIEAVPILLSVNPSPAMGSVLLEARRSALGDQIEIVQSRRPGSAGNTRESIEGALERWPDAALIAHLEDDSVPGPGWLHLMRWAATVLTERPELLVVCPFRPPSDRRLFAAGCSTDRTEDVFEWPWFASQGGFGVTRSTFEELVDAGVFEHALWDRQMNHERWQHRHCVYPSVNRANNIGDVGGMHRRSRAWHAGNVWEPAWTGDGRAAPEPGPPRWIDVPTRAATLVEAYRTLTTFHAQVTVVEVGSLRDSSPRARAGDGHATEFLARAVVASGRRDRFISIDRDTGSARRHLERRGCLGGVELVCADAGQVLTELTGPIHLLYLDGAEDPEEALDQLLLARPRLSPDALVVVDDAGPGTKADAIRPWLAEQGISSWQQGPQLFFRPTVRGTR